MAPGTWNAPGNEHTIASASGVAYCSRSRAALAPCGNKTSAASYRPAAYTPEPE